MAVVVGSVLECLGFGGFGGYVLLLGIALNGRVDAFANDLNFLAAALLLSLAAGFGFGAFLMSCRWIEAKVVGGRIFGAVIHLGATVVAAWGAIWAGLYQVHVDPTYGTWSPWIALAIGAAVIAIGIAVVVSLLLPARQAALPRPTPGIGF